MLVKLEEYCLDLCLDLAHENRFKKKKKKDECRQETRTRAIVAERWFRNVRTVRL